MSLPLPLLAGPHPPFSRAQRGLKHHDMGTGQALPRSLVFGLLFLNRLIFLSCSSFSISPVLSLHAVLSSHLAHFCPQSPALHSSELEQVLGSLPTDLFLIPCRLSDAPGHSLGLWGGEAKWGGYPGAFWQVPTSLRDIALVYDPEGEPFRVVSSNREFASWTVQG